MLVEGGQDFGVGDRGTRGDDVFEAAREKSRGRRRKGDTREVMHARDENAVGRETHRGEMSELVARLAPCGTAGAPLGARVEVAGAQRRCRFAAGRKDGAVWE